MTSIIALSISIILIVLDYIIKLWALNSLSLMDEIKVVSDWIVLSYVENRGAAFGMFQGQSWLLVGITSVAIIGCIVAIVLKFIKDKWIVYSLSLIIAGGIGNLIDRVFRGFVVDYIYVKIIDFPVFNLADICVCVGCFALVFYIAFFDKTNRKEIKTQINE